MRRFLCGLCWFLLVAGATLLGLVMTFQRNLEHALWALPIDLTMMLAGFLGLMILHLLPPARVGFALGVERGIRIGQGELAEQSRADEAMTPKSAELRLVR